MSSIESITSVFAIDKVVTVFGHSRLANTYDIFSCEQKVLERANQKVGLH